MGRIIRRTVTITITESWTIVWTGETRADDQPQRQTAIMVQDQVKTQEEQDELLQATITTVDAGNPDADNPTTTPKPAVNNQRKRSRSHRASANQQST